MLDEIPEDAEGWPRRVGRRPDDRDPAGRPKRTLDAGVVEDRDGTATLVEIEEGSRSPMLLAACLAGLVVGQVAASRS